MAFDDKNGNLILASQRLTIFTLQKNGKFVLSSTFEVPGGYICSLYLIESSNLLLSTSVDSKFVAWKLKKNENSYSKNQVLKGHNNYVRSIEYSNEHNLLITGDKDGLIIIWTIEKIKQTKFRKI